MSLKRSQLKRNKGLRSRPRPTTALTPGRRLLLDPIADNMRRAWGRAARKRPCACCGFRAGHAPGVVEGHHVLPLNRLKQEVKDQLAWYDQRIMLPLCSDPAPKRCHDRLDDGIDPLRLTRQMILAKCPGALEYAREWGIEWWFDQLYPKVVGS